MACVLKRQYDLLDLKVSLDTSASPAAIVLQLERAESGRIRALGTWRVGPDELGLAQPFGMGRDRELEAAFTFPRQTGELIEAALKTDAKRHPWDAEAIPVLWLHLVKPYGILGAVPWERLLLGYVTPRAIIRLPDFVVRPPRETPRTLDVVLCGSNAFAKEPINLDADLIEFATTIGHAVLPRRATVHIFTDKAVHDRLLQVGLAAPKGGEEPFYRLYGPPAPDAADETRGTLAEGGLDNPWLRWILRGMAGRKVDVVHFISHGYLAVENPALALAESPAQTADRAGASFIDPGSLHRFLTRLGAWSLMCTSPPSDYSPMGLRLLVDTVAQGRPGSFLYHEYRNPGSDRGLLSSAYEFLFLGASFDEGLLPPPIGERVFLYCQPFHLTAPPSHFDDESGVLFRQTREFARSDDEADLESSPVVVSRGGVQPPAVAAKPPADIPSWIATTERFLEQSRWQLMTWERDAATGELDDARREQIRGLREAVDAIERAAARTVRLSESDSATDRLEHDNPDKGTEMTAGGTEA